MEVNTNLDALVYLLQRNRYYKKLSEAVELAGKYKKNNKVYFYTFHDLKTNRKYRLNGNEIIYAIRGININPTSENNTIFINFFIAYQEAKFLSHVLNKIEQLRRDVQTGKIRTLTTPYTKCECKYYFKIPNHLFPKVVERSHGYDVSEILNYVKYYGIF